MALTDPSWVRAFWVRRQHDPGSADFVPGASGTASVNCTHRDWTTIGTLAGPERATVDPRGLLAASADRWSLDWWIGAEDTWHVPAGDEIVRQRLVGDAPVVETAMRVPGGDALHRVYGYNSTDLGPCAVVELENRTAVPFAVALAVRPYDVLGAGTVQSIDLVDTTVVVNGRPAIVLPRPPAHTVARAGHADCSAELFANAATAGWGGRVDDTAGLATAAFVFPLAHTAILRVVLPLTDAGRPGEGGPRAVGRRRSRPDAAPAALRFPAEAPSAEQVAKGWEAQTRRGLLVTVPDDRLTRQVEVARAQLLLNHGGDELVAPGTELDFAAAAHVIDALGSWGFSDEARQVLARWGEHQAMDGTFVPDGAPVDRRDANGAALGALGRHWVRTRDDELVESLIGPIAKAVHRVEKVRTSRRAERDPAAEELLPVGRAPAGAGGGTAPDDAPGAYLRDDAVTVAGLRSIAAAVEGAGQPGVAEDARRFAANLAAALDEAVRAAGARTGGALPATPSRPLDAGVIANLDLVAPFGAYPADHPAVAATLDLIRSAWVVDGGVFRAIGPSGLDPSLTMALARAEAASGDARAWERVAWMLDHVRLTGVWPGALHPRTGGGAVGAPQDAVANARFLSVVRDLLVHEVVAGAEPRPSGLALLPVVPPVWLGQPIDVRDAPTAFGTLSYSVRWHGDRPALLWELDAHDEGEPCTITVPGLDATWSTTARRGDALLAPVAVPAPVLAERAAAGVAPGGEVHDHTGASDHQHDHDHGGEPTAGDDSAHDDVPPPAPEPPPAADPRSEGPGASFQ